MKKDREEMLDELEEFYEAAGFSDVYENCLKGTSQEEVEELHRETFGQAGS